MELLTYIALGLLTTSTVAQRLIFSDLPPAPYYPDGEFLVPKPATKNGGVINQVYVQGSMMNVTWKTKYPSINLFIGPDDPNGGPTQLLSKRFEGVLEDTSLTRPHSRILGQLVHVDYRRHGQQQLSFHSAFHKRRGLRG
jgi:hypothetical protein